MAEIIRWPKVRAEPTCVVCGQPKMPSLLMCFDCFQKNHVGGGRYLRDTERALSRAERNIEEDPWDAVFEDFNESFPDW